MASFAVVLAIMALVAVFSYRSQQQRDQTVSSMTEAMQVTDRIDDLLIGWIDMQTEWRNYLLVGRQESLDSYQAGQSAFGAAVADLKKLDADDPQEVAAWEEIDRLQSNWVTARAEPGLKLHQDLIDGRATNQQVLDVVKNSVDDLALDAVRAKLIDAKKAEQSLLDQRQSADVAARDLGLAIVLWGTLLAILAGLAIAYVLARSIARSARSMASVADGIARGELDHSIEVTSRDEMGDTAAALRRMVVYLQAMAGAAGRMAEGDLSVEVIPQSDGDVLGSAFAQMVANLRDLVSHVQQSSSIVAATGVQLNSNAEQASSALQQVSATIQQVSKGTVYQAEAVTQVTSNAEQIARAAESIARGAQDQVEAVQRTSDLIVEMTGMIGEMGEAADSVADANGKVAQVARTGVGTVEQTNHGIGQIQLRATEALGKVKDMGTRAAEIGRIVGLITDIADKTDMLALNAAVEAARAGEHGRGFAVVADQVRRLSEDAKVATRDIDKLIERVQDAVREAITAMDASAAQASDGARLVGNTAQSFAEVLRAAEDAASRAERITAVAQQLHRKSEGVVTAMDLVSSVVEENTAAAEQMAASTREVTDAMENIASVTEENSAAAQEVTAATVELTLQSEDVVASARDLSAMAEQMHAAASQFQIERAADDRERDQRGKRPQIASATRRGQVPGFVPARAGQAGDGPAVAHQRPASNGRNGLHKAADQGPPRRSR